MKKHLSFILIAAAAAVPGIVLRLADIHLDPPVMAAASGMAILGASFLLLWACDAAQSDIPQALALAVVALIAVLPEYSVDMYFTWQAGRQETAADRAAHISDGWLTRGVPPAQIIFTDGQPAGPAFEKQYAKYAIANMTGANRLLIGVAWGAIVLLYWLRKRRDVRLEKDRRTELLFLGMATLYALALPLKGSLDWFDALVFLALYGWYIALASRRPCTESEAGGPAELLIRLPQGKRRAATALLFLFSGGAILANAEPFCEGLLGTGKVLQINEFLLVQWLAPLASEAPEFIVALVFTWRGQAGMALGSLLSAKLNQWTLLVGMIPAVYALAHGTISHPMPMGQNQMEEVLLTAAQSMLAVVLLASLRLTLGGALLLFGLFIGQLLAPRWAEAFPNCVPFGFTAAHVRPVFSIVYFITAAAIFLQAPRRVAALWNPAPVLACGCEPPEEPDGKEPPVLVYKTPHCVTCEFRRAAQEQMARK